MEWFLQALNFGRYIEYKGEEYVVLQTLYQGYFLAAKKSDEMPAKVYVIYDENYKTPSDTIKVETKYLGK